MLHLDASVKKEIRNMALGCLALMALELLICYILGLLNLISFDRTWVLAAFGGTLVAICNFLLLALTVQHSVSSGNPKLAKARIQSGYGGRLLFQCIWCILALQLDSLNPIAGIIPLLFPRLVIMLMQLTGYYRKPRNEGGDLS